MILTRALSNFFLMLPSFVRNSANACSSFRRSSTTFRSASVVCLAIAALLAAPAARGAMINYGNFDIPSAGIMFLGVTESSSTDAVPMYGPPDPFVVGLDFDPSSFGSNSTNGTADVTDGQLNFTIMGVSNPNGFVGINNVSLFEAGDYSLAGIGTAATSVNAGAIIRATVTQINGTPIAPINLTPVNGSITNSLPGSVVASPWGLGIGLDINAQLAGLGYQPGQVATKVEVAINNSLLTTSEPGTVAFVAKKDFRIDLSPSVFGNPFVPEPTSLALLGLGSVFGLAWRRSRISG